MIKKTNPSTIIIKRTQLKTTESFAYIFNITIRGKKIKKGDTVMIVEAMKTMNHVPSTSDGIVKEICVDDGQPVEFGQTIIVLE